MPGIVGNKSFGSLPPLEKLRNIFDYRKGMPPPRAGSISSGYGCPLGWKMLLPGPTKLPPGPLVPGGLNDGGMNNGLVYL